MSGATTFWKEVGRARPEVNYTEYAHTSDNTSADAANCGLLYLEKPVQLMSSLTIWFQEKLVGSLKAAIIVRNLTWLQLFAKLLHLTLSLIWVESSWSVLLYTIPITSSKVLSFPFKAVSILYHLQWHRDSKLPGMRSLVGLITPVPVSRDSYVCGRHSPTNPALFTLVLRPL